MGIIPSVSAAELVELLKKGATLEAQEGIMALRQAALDLQDENLSLRGKLRELEEQVRLREELEWDGSVYLRCEPDGTTKSFFCPRCKDADSKLVRLQAADSRTSRHWHCPNCSKYFARKG